MSVCRTCCALRLAADRRRPWPRSAVLPRRGRPAPTTLAQPSARRDGRRPAPRACRTTRACAQSTRRVPRAAPLTPASPPSAARAPAGDVLQRRGPSASSRRRGSRRAWAPARPRWPGATSLTTSGVRPVSRLLGPRTTERRAPQGSPVSVAAAAAGRPAARASRGARTPDAAPPPADSHSTATHVRLWHAGQAEIGTAIWALNVVVFVL